MKSVLVILLSCFTLSCNADTLPEPKVETTIQLKKIEVVHVVKESTKKVCIMVYDSKLKKNVEKCRTIKIHKKYEGTPIPKK